MTVTPTERQVILSHVNTLATQDLVTLWRRAGDLSDGEFAQFITDAFPDVVDPHAALAADLAADWYEQSAPELDYQAVPAGMPNAQVLQESASWALGAVGDAGLARLAGTLQRAVFNSARDTIVDNTDSERGAKWARHAQPDACEFCKLLATRSLGRNATFYSSAEAATSVVGRGKEMTMAERRARAAGNDRISGKFISGGTRTRGSQGLGSKYHDHCRCTAVEIRPGQKYEPPAYVDNFDAEYIKARNAAGSGDLKQILAAWRQI